MLHNVNGGRTLCSYSIAHGSFICKISSFPCQAFTWHFGQKCNLELLCRTQYKGEKSFNYIYLNQIICP